MKTDVCQLYCTNAIIDIKPLMDGEFLIFSGVTGTLTACNTTMFMGIYINYILLEKDIS